MKNVSSIINDLQKEYGFILDSLKDCNFVDLETISIEKIKLNTSVLEKIKEENLSKYNSILEPIIIQEIFGQHFLIDGYHRVAFALSKNKLTIDAYILKKV